MEVGKRAVSAPLTTGMRISSSADLFKHYHPSLRDLRHEIFSGGPAGRQEPDHS